MTTTEQLDALQARPYVGPKLTLRYTDANNLTVIHHLPGSVGYAVWVVGNPGNASYEWIVESAGKRREHSDCGYGDSDVALRDGLIVRHGLPSENNAVVWRKLASESLNELQELRKQIVHGGEWTKKVDDLFARARKEGYER